MASFQINVQFVVYQTEVSPCPYVDRDGRRMLQKMIGSVLVFDGTVQNQWRSFTFKRNWQWEREKTIEHYSKATLKQIAESAGALSFTRVSCSNKGTHHPVL